MSVQKGVAVDRFTERSSEAPGRSGRGHGDWVKRFAEEERQRESVRNRAAAEAAHQSEVTRSQLLSLLETLRERVARDVKAFAREFPDRAITVESHMPGSAFVVKRDSYPEVRLSVEPNRDAASIRVQYVFASSEGTVVPKLRELVVCGHTEDTLHFKDEEAQHSFRNLDQLSEYLLVPVFSGRPR